MKYSLCQIPYIYFLYSFAVVLFFLLPLCAKASISYTVAPLVVNQTLNARDIRTETVTLTNTGVSPITIYPTVNNIKQSEDGSIEEFLPPVMSDQTRSLASWVEISRKGIELGVGEVAQVSLVLHINPNPVPGTYHALVGFPFGGNRDEAERKVKDGQAPGVVVTVTIEDTKKEELRLSKFIVDRFVVRETNDAAQYTFSNSGDETVVPHGEIIIYNTSGEEIQTIPVNAENVTIAPSNVHTFSSQIPTTGLFGKYKAFLSVAYGTKQKATVYDTSYFYVFPMRSIIIVMSIISILTILIAWYIHKKYFDTKFDLEDTNRISVRVREATSSPHERDVDLSKKKSDSEQL